jgi:hypothetical protein
MGIKPDEGLLFQQVMSYYGNLFVSTAGVLHPVWWKSNGRIVARCGGRVFEAILGWKEPSPSLAYVGGTSFSELAVGSGSLSHGLVNNFIHTECCVASALVNVIHNSHYRLHSVCKQVGGVVVEALNVDVTSFTSGRP